MKFIEAIKYIGKGRIVYLKSKPEFLLFTTAHMKIIEPKYTYPTIAIFNTKTKEENHYYYVEDIKSFTEEEKESEDWVVESAQNIDTCKELINSLIDVTQISQLICDIQGIQSNYYNNVKDPDFKDKIFHLAINHQLLEAVVSLQRVLMYAGLPYEFPKETENNNVFELKFEDETISNLVGNKYGCFIFNEQVKYNISYNEPITIIFPDYIENISSSFIGGFFEEILKTIGFKGIEEKITIKSNTISDIKEMIIKKLSYYNSEFEFEF